MGQMKENCFTYKLYFRVIYLEFKLTALLNVNWRSDCLWWIDVLGCWSPARRIMTRGKVAADAGDLSNMVECRCNVRILSREP